ncbi:uncharacterized protein LOC128922322 [Zeugodacus cucurbitae]|uniref:uncharacterized protein LOC128922322 n=1 Tax=Zeugodacus cucurbitae TaxID=28588 RepID=UPI0023D933FD|nr:uncharacterized protein LOC128922322 [Zeugodacus cucurbitae]
MQLKLHTLVAMLIFFLLAHQTSARPAAMPNPEDSKDLMNKLKSIFKVGDGIMVYNTATTSEGLEDDEIICAERRNGKSLCKPIDSLMEATRLDKIDPEQFAKLKELI